MTFRSAELRFRLFAILMAAVGATAVYLGWTLDVGWQRAAAFLGLGAIAYLGFMFGVFEFANRVRPILQASGGDIAPLLAWGNRWMGISMGVVLALSIGGIVEIIRADGWIERIAIFFTVGCAALLAAMGLIFGFCALPQTRVAPPAGQDEPPSEEPSERPN